MTSHLGEEFTALMEQNQGILYKVALAYCRSPEAREDLIQEMAVQLWRAFPRFDPRKARFSTWMYRVALNVAISFGRRSERYARRFVPQEDEHLLQATAPAGQAEEVRILDDLIRRLDPWNKALAVLYLDGYSHDEIATVLGISPANAATKVARLKKALQEGYRND